MDDNGDNLYNHAVVPVVIVVVYFLGDDNSNNLYNHAVVPVVIVFVFAIQIVCLHLHSKIVQRKNGPSCLDLSLKILKILAHRKSSTIFAFNKQNKS